MRNSLAFLFRAALLLGIWLIWLWAIGQPLSDLANLSIVVGGLLPVFPLVWFARKLLDRKPTVSRAVRITTFVHYSLGIFFGLPIVRALTTYREWMGWRFPVPEEIGLVLVWVTGVATSLTVINLALKGLGAPFAIALSRKLAVGWMYAWTRNPMVLTCLALLVSLGIWFQSGLFLLWAIFLFAPALLFFIKVYEERELEIRFGASYLEYKTRTPMLFPRRPRS
jgi:protein-S-isoprenylcysteine O-methyltransferase Ste14